MKKFLLWAVALQFAFVPAIAESGGNPALSMDIIGLGKPGSMLAVSQRLAQADVTLGRLLDEERGLSLLASNADGTLSDPVALADATTHLPLTTVFSALASSAE